MEPEYRSYALDLPGFHENLKSADILGLTNWVWNQNYNDKIAQIYKKYRPDGIVVYGGTNVPENLQLSRLYASDRPYVDLFFCGPAEENFKNFLIYLPVNKFNKVDGAFTHKEFRVIKDRNSYRNIPIVSPYLDGVFEGIIQKAVDPLSAIFETNRGCPYRCSFCDWGGMTRSKIVKASPDLVKETISYIMKHNKVNRIEIADANFGLFEVDLEYMQHLVHCKNKRETEIDLTFGGFAKNGSPFVEPIMELMHQHFDAYRGRKYIKLSFQSHDPTVLEIAQRSNIKNEKLFPMVERFRAKGVDIDAEMIIGLPGDNQERWLTTIQKNMDLRVNHQKSFMLYVVPNTSLTNPSYKEKYGIKTKKLLIPHDLYQIKSSRYHASRTSSPIISQCDFNDPSTYQSSEHIYECFSFDSQELMRIYDVWFWFNTLYNAKIARQWMIDSNDSAHTQFFKFMNYIETGQMPFFEKLLKEFRYGVWHTIAKPEPITCVKELFLANFAVKFASRGNEIVDIFNNQGKALEELKLLYPDISFAHFRKSNHLMKNIHRLYFVGAEVI